MNKIRCEIHDQGIVVYEANERHLFKDDNRRETVIFINEGGSRILKRFVAGGCDEDCPNLKKVFEEQA